MGEVMSFKFVTASLSGIQRGFPMENLGFVVMDNRCWCFLCLIMVLARLSPVYANTEGDALNVWKNNLIDPNNVLRTWDSSLDNPCTWSHVTCNNENSVTRVDLGNANLSGLLVPQLGQLQNLRYLELYNNKIRGRIPTELGGLVNLVGLDLSLNSLTGPIPDALGKLRRLQFMILNNNTLSGRIPMSLTAIDTLQIFDVSNNKITGPIPINGSFQLFTPISFANNPLDMPPPFSLPPPLQLATRPATNGFTGAVPGGVGVGAFLLFAISTAVSAVIWYQRKKLQNHFIRVPAEEGPIDQLGQIRRFSLRELQVATNNFSNRNFIGRGGCGKVYKGQLIDGLLVAVKRLKKDYSHGAYLRFQAEIEMVNMTVHRNLLHLCGFCMTPTERLLVYPFMVNGSVASCLIGQPDSQPPLDWQIRKRIALGAAEGIAYLHDECDPKIFHRDVKASNILLDADFEAVVGDFGLAKLTDHKDTHITTAVRGTIGHIAPEYISTGKYYEKSDLFGYGVMLLELITGQRAFDLARLANDEDIMLLDWVKKFFKQKKFETFVDANLEGCCTESEVEQLTQVALLCTQSSPTKRPKMSEVVRMLEGDGLAERWDEWQEEERMVERGGLTERWEEWQNQEIFQQQFENIHCPNGDGILLDSTPNVRPDELSGPR